ncbi:tRNA-uridine aminocarboxypropyltransferase A isoform X2 [Elaeis guineensis]|uniref:tRNA-uridine aminocarboxypropyltransferase n=1 Tax=Elaeis guineensis var. tenera TaxID=51953 RepID=A0A6J0PNB7_ELAGV|nr:DTW domain-containing protein 2 isoform X1 [Elaeis guineensis]
MLMVQPDPALGEAPPFPGGSGGGGAGEGETEEAAAPATKGRAVCWDGCGRPSSVCVCDHLPSCPIPTATRVVVLHHPHELRRKLATLPVLSKCLHNLYLLPGRRLRLGSSPLLDSLYHSSPSPTKALFLFPSSDPSSPVADLGAWVAATPPADRRDPVLIVFDGTWREAKEMVAASLPFLSRFAVRVSLGCDEGKEGESIFESELLLRKEPFLGCVSTMEAVARALRVLEPDGAGADIEARLLAVLRAMVGFQAANLKPMKSRPRLQKKKEIKKKSYEEELERGINM